MARSWAVPTMMLAVLLAAASALLAQEVATPAGSEVEATGYLSPVYAQDTYLLHLLNDEKTGVAYFARSEDVDLDSYDYGQRVDVVGNLVIDKGYPEPILQVAGVEPVEDLPPGETATLTFELSVEGETPPDATIFGTVRGEGPRYVPLTGTGTQGPDESDSLRPGEPTSVVEDFGPVRTEDQSLSATVSFEEDRRGNTTPSPGDGASDEGEPNGLLDSAASSIRGLLPDTGGAAILALIGAGVLLVGGLLIRRLFR